MSDQSNAAQGVPQNKAELYDLRHIIGPEDQAVFLAAGHYAGKRGRIDDCAFYAVIHRRFGTWTHLYRVVPSDPVHGFVIYLEKAFDGEAVGAARDWLRVTFNLLLDASRRARSSGEVPSSG